MTSVTVTAVENTVVITENGSTTVVTVPELPQLLPSQPVHKAPKVKPELATIMFNPVPLPLGPLTTI